MFGIIILLRVLFITCMVFILGYVFGGFSRNPTLTVFTKIAAILAIVLFIGTNVFFMRSRHAFGPHGERYQCGWYDKDSTNRQQQQQQVAP
jgi:hypothetical protein